MKVLTRKAKFALSGGLSPAAIGFGAHLAGVGMTVIGTIAIVYGSLWALMAIISFFVAAERQDLYTDEYDYSLRTATERLKWAEAELSRERELRERFQAALTDGRP